MCGMHVLQALLAFGGYNGKYQSTVSVYHAPASSSASIHANGTDADVTMAPASTGGAAAASGNAVSAGGNATRSPEGAAAAPVAAPPPSAVDPVLELKATINELKVGNVFREYDSNRPPIYVQALVALSA